MEVLWLTCLLAVFVCFPNRSIACRSRLGSFWFSRWVNDQGVPFPKVRTVQTQKTCLWKKNGPFSKARTGLKPRKPTPKLPWIRRFRWMLDNSSTEIPKLSLNRFFCVFLMPCLPMACDILCPDTKVIHRARVTM